MAASFNSIIDFVNDNLLFIILIAVGIYALWYFSRPREKVFHRKNLSKEIKRELDYLYRLFFNPVNKPINAGLIKVGFVTGYMPIAWDKSISLRQNLKANKQFKGYVKKHGPIKPDMEEMYCFKIHGLGWFNKLKAMIGFGCYYALVPTNIVTNSDKIIISPNVIPTRSFNVVVYSKAGKEFTENIAYKLTREEELEELVNFIPKQNFLEVDTASRVARARENAKIEREKYKGQLESAESV